MVKIHRILFPTDFSQNANAARDLACGLAEQNDAELHLLHVIFEPTYLLPEPQFITFPNIPWEELEMAANESLRGVLEPGMDEKLRIVRSVRRGPPFLEILNYSQQKAIDLIVMSTHGRTGLSHLLMGSVAENVVRKARCPVLTVHPTDHLFVQP